VLESFGGVVANSLNSCKRFYHSPVQPEETGFTALAKTIWRLPYFTSIPLSSA
jgi:hypothetical protein